MQALKTRAQFDAVLAGQVLAKTSHFVLHSRDLDMQALTQLGLPRGQVLLSPMVPKRWARRAVTRNLIKRQIRAMAWDQAQHWPQRGYVVRLRAGFKPPMFVSASSDVLRKAVRQELQQLFAQVQCSTTGLVAAADPGAGLEGPTPNVDTP